MSIIQCPTHLNPSSRLGATSANLCEDSEASLLDQRFSSPAWGATHSLCDPTLTSCSKTSDKMTSWPILTLSPDPDFSRVAGPASGIASSSALSCFASGVVSMQADWSSTSGFFQPRSTSIFLLTESPGEFCLDSTSLIFPVWILVRIHLLLLTNFFMVFFAASAEAGG